MIGHPHTKLNWAVGLSIATVLSSVGTFSLSRHRSAASVKISFNWTQLVMRLALGGVDALLAFGQVAFVQVAFGQVAPSHSILLAFSGSLWRSPFEMSLIVARFIISSSALLIWFEWLQRWILCQESFFTSPGFDVESTARERKRVLLLLEVRSEMGSNASFVQ